MSNIPTLAAVVVLFWGFCAITHSKNTGPAKCAMIVVMMIVSFRLLIRPWLNIATPVFRGSDCFSSSLNDNSSTTLLYDTIDCGDLPEWTGGTANLLVSFNFRKLQRLNTHPQTSPTVLFEKALDSDIEPRVESTLLETEDVFFVVNVALMINDRFRLIEVCFHGFIVTSPRCIEIGNLTSINK